MQTNVRLYQTFDIAEFEDALKAADFDRCHQLIDGSETPDGIIAGARLASRERRFFDVIGSLSDFPEIRAGFALPATSFWARLWDTPATT